MFARRSLSKSLGKVRYNSSHTGASEGVTEDFSSPIWRNTALLGVTSYLLYKADQLYAERHEGQGYAAALMEYYLPDPELWRSRNVKHFDLGKEAADARLLLQSAQKPSMRQLRYPASVSSTIS